MLNRREFLEAAGSAVASGTALLSLPLASVAATSLWRERLIPLDKGMTPALLASLKQRGQRRIYREASRYAIGMPCGGVAAGQLYILGDGTLGGWHIDGRLNPTGYGSESYRTRRPPRQLRQGFRIVTNNVGSDRIAAVLADPESGGHYDAIEFIGEYPVAEVRYKSSDGAAVPPPPIDITLHAGSPFIPLNSRDSAIPCTILRFALHNRSAGPISGALQGWLQNGVEPVEPGQPAAIRRNRVLREAGLTSVMMDAIAEQDEDVNAAPPPPRSDRVLFDFEQDQYRGWSVEGQAFGSKPAQGTQPNQNPVTGFAGHGLVNSYAGSDTPTGKMLSDAFTIDRRYLTFLIGGGGGRDAKRTCINLLVDDKVARTAAGQNNERLEPAAWDVREFNGRQAQIQIVDAATGPWGHINVDQITLVDRLPAELRRPRPDSHANGSMALSFLGDCKASAGCDPATLAIEPQQALVQNGDQAPVVLLEAPFTLGAGQSIELRFVITWHFPNLHTSQGQMYSNWFADAMEVARYLVGNAERLLGQTELFRRTFHEDTTLPWWLALRLMMPVANLATGTAQWWKNGRFWAWEGVGCCHGTCTHVWNYAQAEARLFPDLARSTRVMQDLGSAFEESTGRVAFRGEVKGGSPYAADGQAGTILKCYREHLICGDDAFLTANWPRIKQAMDYLIARDAEQSPDGKPDGVILGHQPNTFDIDFVGANTFVGSLYLAALHACAAMAQHAGDQAMVDRCRDIAARGKAWTQANIFNGEYFVQQTPAGDATPFQYGPGCISDQLFGQNWARSLDLPSLYDEAMVRKALSSVFRYNWAPPIVGVGPYNAKFPPERAFARDREAGLFVCTWPKGGRPGEPVHYRDEVWTGIEYQVAAGMVWEGLLDEALMIVKAVDDRYDGALHNPWNEVECGDHYARAMASWGVLLALVGFVYDGPAGLIGMAPRLTPEDFAAFFSAAEGWGRLVQKREGRSQTNRVEVRWGRVRVSGFTAELPKETAAAAPKCQVQVGGRVMLAAVERDSERFIARLGSPVLVEAEQSLELRWTW